MSDSAHNDRAGWVATCCCEIPSRNCSNSAFAGSEDFVDYVDVVVAVKYDANYYYYARDSLVEVDSHSWRCLMEMICSSCFWKIKKMHSNIFIKKNTVKKSSPVIVIVHSSNNEMIPEVIQAMSLSTIRSQAGSAGEF